MQPSHIVLSVAAAAPTCAASVLQSDAHYVHNVLLVKHISAAQQCKKVLLDDVHGMWILFESRGTSDAAQTTRRGS
jgi:hypothetical protein